MDMPTATIPVAILTALSRAISRWVAKVYSGATASLEAARRDPTARLSNGMRLRFTLVVYADGAAYGSRHARLASGDTDARAPVVSAPMRREGRRPLGD